MQIRVRNVEGVIVVIIKDDPQRCGRRDLQVVLTKDQVRDLVAQLQAVTHA